MGVTVVKSFPELGTKIKKEELAPLMRELSQGLVSSAQRKINSDMPPPNSPLTQAIKQGDKTLRDSGALMASISGKSGADWASAGTNLKYAKIQQDGGTITAKKGELWIPASAKTRSLMNSFNATKAGELIPAMRAAGYNMWRSGKVFIAKKGNRGKPFALFILKKSVQIPSRPFLHIDEKDEEYINKKIKEFIRRQLGGEK